MSLKIIDSERLTVKGVTYRFNDDPLGNCRCCDFHSERAGGGATCQQPTAPCTTTLREDGREGHYRREVI